MRKRRQRRSYVGKLLQADRIPVKLFAKKAKLNIVTAYKVVYGKPVTRTTAEKACKSMKSLNILATTTEATILGLRIALIKNTRCRKSTVKLSKKRTRKFSLPKKRPMKKDKKPPK